MAKALAPTRCRAPKAPLFNEQAKLIKNHFCKEVVFFTGGGRCIYRRPLRCTLVRAMAQTSQNAPSSNEKQTVTKAKVHGYVNGMRLDSVDADCAEFTWRLLRSGLLFDDGQSGEKQSNTVLTDKGRRLVFEPGTIAMILIS